MVRALNALIAALWPLAVIVGFTIFDNTYQTIWLIILPGLLILLTIGLAFTGRAPGRLWRLALIVWIGLVTWGHWKLIGIAAASV